MSENLLESTLVVIKSEFRLVIHSADIDNDITSVKDSRIASSREI